VDPVQPGPDHAGVRLAQRPRRTLTLRKAYEFYGPGLFACAAGLLLWAALELPATLRGPDVARRRAAGCFVLAVACAAFYLVTPFSGAYEWFVAHPLKLNSDNLRLLMPTGVVLLPLAAAGLSRIGRPRWVALGLAALWLMALAMPRFPGRLPHIAPASWWRQPRGSPSARCAAREWSREPPRGAC